MGFGDVRSVGLYVRGRRVPVGRVPVGGRPAGRPFDRPAVMVPDPGFGVDGHGIPGQRHSGRTGPPRAAHSCSVTRAGYRSTGRAARRAGPGSARRGGRGARRPRSTPGRVHDRDRPRGLPPRSPLRTARSGRRCGGWRPPGRRVRPGGSPARRASPVQTSSSPTCSAMAPSPVTRAPAANRAVASSSGVQLAASPSTGNDRSSAARASAWTTPVSPASNRMRETSAWTTDPDTPGRGDPERSSPSTATLIFAIRPFRTDVTRRRDRR